MYIALASLPALYPLFNVTRRKGGRPGRSGYVIGHYLGRGVVTPPTCPRTSHTYVQ